MSEPTHSERMAELQRRYDALELERRKYDKLARIFGAVSICAFFAAIALQIVARLMR